MGRSVKKKMDSLVAEGKYRAACSNGCGFEVGKLRETFNAAENDRANLAKYAPRSWVEQCHGGQWTLVGTMVE
jgi:hypothetical protein